ncbi:hypothetical protein V7075_20995 [Neobacillus drentensis]|uniref:hypothetical protein n=1 Tax=Neobacillus drentensis TaxID=220684 RepID=UPI002FFD8B0F
MLKASMKVVPRKRLFRPFIGTEESFFLFLAVLKVNIDFRTLLICAEGARLLQEDGTGETPQAL